jgi:pantetheine-phosphate adenylyltransferase
MFSIVFFFNCFQLFLNATIGIIYLFIQSPMSAVFPVTFDPWTQGHAQILRRALTIFPTVVVLVCVNSEKQRQKSPMPMEGLEKRAQAVRESLDASIRAHVSVCAWEGLVADYCAQHNPHVAVLVRGVRSALDFEQELALAQANLELFGIDTVFFGSTPQLSFVTSTLARTLQHEENRTRMQLPALRTKILASRL